MCACMCKKKIQTYHFGIKSNLEKKRQPDAITDEQKFKMRIVSPLPETSILYQKESH